MIRSGGSETLIDATISSILRSAHQEIERLHTQLIQAHQEIDRLRAVVDAQKTRLDEKNLLFASLTQYLLGAGYLKSNDLAQLQQCVSLARDPVNPPVLAEPGQSNSSGLPPNAGHAELMQFAHYRDVWAEKSLLELELKDVQQTMEDNRSYEQREVSERYSHRTDSASSRGASVDEFRKLQTEFHLAQNAARIYQDELVQERRMMAAMEDQVQTLQRALDETLQIQSSNALDISLESHDYASLASTKQQQHQQQQQQHRHHQQRSSHRRTNPSPLGPRSQYLHSPAPSSPSSPTIVSNVQSTAHPRINQTLHETSVNPHQENSTPLGPRKNPSALSDSITPRHYSDNHRYSYQGQAESFPQQGPEAPPFIRLDSHARVGYDQDRGFHDGRRDGFASMYEPREETNAVPTTYMSAQQIPANSRETQREITEQPLQNFKAPTVKSNDSRQHYSSLRQAPISTRRPEHRESSVIISPISANSGQEGFQASSNIVQMRNSQAADNTKQQPQETEMFFY